MIFWKKTYEYIDIIENAPTITELEKFCKEHDFNLIVDKNNTTRWAAAAYMYGVEHELDPYVCTSFSNMIATYMTGATYTSSTNTMFDERRIDRLVLNAYDDMGKIKNLSEKDRVKLLFEFIFNLYAIDIGNYELKNRVLNVRLTERQYQRFMNVEGDSKTDKLKNLLKLSEKLDGGMG
jgi:hypothetical protein